MGLERSASNGPRTAAAHQQRRRVMVTDKPRPLRAHRGSKLGVTVSHPGWRVPSAARRDPLVQPPMLGAERRGLLASAHGSGQRRGFRRQRGQGRHGHQRGVPNRQGRVFERAASSRREIAFRNASIAGSVQHHAAHSDLSHGATGRRHQVRSKPSSTRPRRRGRSTH